MLYNRRTNSGQVWIDFSSRSDDNDDDCGGGDVHVGGLLAAVFHDIYCHLCLWNSAACTDDSHYACDALVVVGIHWWIQMRDYLCGMGMSHDLWQGPDTGDNALNSLHRLQVDIHGSDDLCVYDGDALQ